MLHPARYLDDEGASVLYEGKARVNMRCTTRAAKPTPKNARAWHLKNNHADKKADRAWAHAPLLARQNGPVS